MCSAMPSLIKSSPAPEEIYLGFLFRCCKFLNQTLSSCPALLLHDISLLAQLKLLKQLPERRRLRLQPSFQLCKPAEGRAREHSDIMAHLTAMSLLKGYFTD